MKHLKLIVPVIVISQFCCTSLWFAGNGVINDLTINFNLKLSALGHLTSAVQFGFIIGTLIFAIFTIADRYSPSKVFLICALLGSLFNLAVIWESNSLISLLLFRFFTGFFLAGIYPVGMKIAADYYQKGLNKPLGFLVGALVLGTAFPHLLNEMTYQYPWRSVLIATSSLAVLGGLLMFIMVPDGPYRKSSQRTNLSAFFSIFHNQEFRSVAFGYFGHMWELYAFWAFVPLMLKKYSLEHPQTLFNIPMLSFLIIGIGGLSCILGSYLAQTAGTKRTAYIALFLSCGCCLISPVLFASDFESLFIGFLMLWGLVVIADSPLLSALVAQNAPAELKGTALTIVNCLGFSITIFSIQIITRIIALTDSNGIYTILAIGPILGLIALRKKNKITIPKRS
ncbi:MFS transporter [Lacinutrix sp. Hel_I_90]|uniref:MFS transporter n=1 Tax=Lacinutrix sp. Hel_I_90 TaxID=1249999 RepID=UPI0005C80863|nr:MFS transporter [Lacinutrix sp. Hel_I_90]